MAIPMAVMYSRWKYKNIKVNLHVIIGIRDYTNTVVITCLQVFIGGCCVQWDLIELQYKVTSITGDALHKTFT